MIYVSFTLIMDQCFRRNEGNRKKKDKEFIDMNHEIHH